MSRSISSSIVSSSLRNHVTWLRIRARTADLEHLPTTLNHSDELLGLRIGQRSGSWSHRLGEPRERFGVDRVGLREPPRCFGEVSDLARIHDRGRTNERELRCNRDLEAARRLEHDERRLELGDTLDQRRDAFRRVRVTTAIVGARREVEMVLRNIDTHKHERLLA